MPLAQRQMHRGTRLVVEPAAETTAVLRVEYPPHLYTALACNAYAVVFRAAMSIAGVRDPVVELVERGPARAAYRARW